MNTGRARRLELAALLVVLGLAALLRLPGLDARGRWDSDQGHDMLVLQGLVARGEVPLLGPPISIGTFHHGALYYYLLAPAAVVSGADPVAVTGEIALFGIAAVAATWWLARLVGGPLAGGFAGLLAAVSPAGIEGSTFIWNPNLVPLASAVAFAAALRARRTGSVRWWLVSAAGAMVAMQCHLLAGIVMAPLGVAWLLDVRERRRSGAPVRPVLLAGAGAVAIVTAGFLPLLAWELGRGFPEARAAAEQLGVGVGTGDLALPLRLVLVAGRSLSWPLAGLLTDHPAAALLGMLAVVVLGALAIQRGPRTRGRAAAGIAGAIALCASLLAVAVPSLATITPGLPNDHYHAFLDPLVLALTGAGLARLATLTPRHERASGGPVGTPRGVRLLPPAAAITMTAGLVLVGMPAWPPVTAADGGWSLAAATAKRVLAAAGPDATVTLVGLPTFKPSDALGFPLARAGLVTEGPGAAATPGRLMVVVCDPLFDESTGTPCGGPAEDRWLAGRTPAPVLLERWSAGTRRVVSLYRAP